MKKRNTVLPKNSIGLTTKALAVWRKDLLCEFRTRYAINAILLFGVTTLIVVSFSVGQKNLPPEVYAALFWIIIFFSAMSGLAHVFVREEESKTATVLRLTSDPTPVYLGKLGYNVVLLALLQVIIAPLFLVLTDAVCGDPVLVIVIIVIGSIGLAGATTLIAAIIARASVKGALFAVLSFPILLPLLIGVINGTTKAMTPKGGGWAAATSDLQLLVSYAVVMITASLLLFEYVWEEE
jgi:heme exporter protein B